MEIELEDVIIIGAGAAGLMAAWELVQTGKKVVMVEAAGHAGGRMRTLHDPQFDQPVELGAEFVHGKLELSRMLMEKAMVRSYEVQGEVWRNEKGQLQKSDFIEDYAHLEQQFKKLKQDIPVKEFLDTYLGGTQHEDLRRSLTSYVEGYYAADPSDASTFAMREELQQGEDAQYRVEGGYIKLVEYLTKILEEKGTAFYFNAPVQEVRWKKDHAQVICGDQSFRAKKLLVTVSLGVLQAEAIRFTPQLTQITKAVKQLGFGPVIKVILQFKEPFWKEKKFTQGEDLSKLGFLFSEEKVPTWWTNFPKTGGMITGWIAGPNADRMKHNTDEEILLIALNSLSNILSLEVSLLLGMLRSSHVANWIKDPFVLGGYAYDTVDAQTHRAIVSKSVENTIFFAGEGLHNGV